MHNDFWAINILCISAYEQIVCQMGVENANTRTAHKFLKNFANDTDVTQQKFIRQLVIQDKTWIYHFDSESEQCKHAMELTNRSKLSFQPCYYKKQILF